MSNLFHFLLGGGECVKVFSDGKRMDFINNKLDPSSSSGASKIALSSSEEKVGERRFNMCFKKILFTLLFFQAFSAFSQNLKVDTLLINGKINLVYPYKIEVEGSRSSLFYMQDEDPVFYTRNRSEITPVLDSLPSGEYLVLWAFPESMKKIEKSRRKRNEHIAARINIEKGKLNGSAIFYFSDATIKATGTYLNGVRNGVWKEYYFNQKSLTESNFMDGVEEGWHRYYKRKADSAFVLKSEFFQEKNDSVSHYTLFHDNGKVQIKMDSAIKGRVFTNAYWSESIYSDYHDSTEQKLVQLKIDFKKHNTSFNRVFRKKYLRTLKVTISGYHPAMHCSVPVDVPFNVYHDNGNFFGRFQCHEKTPFQYNSTYMYIALGDTLFGYKGQPAVVRQNMPDSIGLQRYQWRSYAKDSSFHAIAYYVKDSTGFFQKYEQINYFRGGKVYSRFEDYSYFFNKDSAYLLKDTLIYLRTIPGSDKKKEYYSPLIPNRTFTVDQDLCPGKSTIDLHIIQGGENYAYYYVKRCGDLKVVSYYSNWNNTNGVRLGSVLSSDGIMEDVWRNKQIYLVGAGWNQLDSIKVFYENKPYTGDMYVQFDDGKNLGASLQDNKLIVEYKPFGYRWRQEKKLPCVQMYLKLNEGNVERIKFYGEVNTELGKEMRQMDFKNNLLHGRDQVYFEKVHLGLFKTRILNYYTEYENGLKNGKRERWDQDYSNKNKWYLAEADYYKDNHFVDTSFYYYFPNSRPSTYPHDEKGKLHGVAISYEGDLKATKEYKHGLKHGWQIKINEYGDTSRIRFIEDKADGLLELHEVSSSDYFPSFHLTNYFKNDTMVGPFIYKDKYNVTRLKMEVLRSFEAYGNRSWHYFHFNEWQEMAVSGRVSLYHSNGNLYCTGSVLLDGRKASYDDKCRKFGLWKYYNSVGKKINEINYPLEDSLSADFIEFYSNGNLKYEGQLVDEYDEQDCVSDLKEQAFEVNYKTYINEQGDTLVKNGNGKVAVFYRDGLLEYEGEVKNKLPEGWWKKYNKEGKLIQVGQYKEGLKHGRWLQGDLTGINYLDDKCFESEQEKVVEQEEVKLKISIIEFFYDKGKMISSNTYNIDRGK